MKKVFFAIATLLSMAFGASAQNPGEDNGFGIKLHVGALSAKGDVEYDGKATGFEGKVSGIDFGVDLSNRWYVWHNDKFGIAVDAHWMDFSFGSGELEIKQKLLGSQKYDGTAFELGLLGVGPMFTFYLGNEMAIDGYYNFIPNTMFLLPEDMDEDDSFYWGVGYTNKVGAAFRWKFLQAGLEYSLGNIELENSEESDESIDADTNNFRVVFGFKF